MAQDEIGTVIELEVKGFVYLLKGVMAAIKIQIQQINAFHNWKNKNAATGSHNWSYIKAWSDDTPQVVQIPENLGDEWQDFCRRNKIPYCDSIPDFDLTDRRTPVLFRSQDVIMIQQFIKPYVDELNRQLETEKSNYEKLEDKLNEIIRTSSDPEEVRKAQIALENTKVAKEQLQGVIDKNDEYTKSGNAMSFFDYLKMGANTEIEKDPALALAKLNEGIEISKEYHLSEAMMLIRDSSILPEDKTIYLTCTAEDSKLFIKREFTLDENGLAVSTSKVFRDGKEIGSFSDEGLTPAEYREVLKSKFAEIGITDAEYEQLMFRTDLSETSFKAYREWLDSPEKKDDMAQEASRKVNMKKDDYIGAGESISPKKLLEEEEEHAKYNKINDPDAPKEASEEAKKFQKKLTADRVNRKDNINNGIIEISLDSSKLLMIEGKPTYDVDGVGSVIGIEQRKDAAGNFKIAIHDERKYEVIDSTGQTKTLTGGEIRGLMNSIQATNNTVEKPKLTAGRAR